MALSEETVNTLLYFFTEKSVDRWTGWEENKDRILQELPLLRMYLEKEIELEALGKAVLNELRDVDCSDS